MRLRTLLGLIAVYFVYLLIGAGIFYAFEFNREERVCRETITELDAIFAKLENDTFHNFTVADMNNLLQVMLAASDNGVVFDSNRVPRCAHNWYYNSAFFFAGTVVTTIGYGNISPQTSGGKAFCIVYAIFGIPLFGIMMAGIGTRIAKRIKKLNSRIERRITKRVRLRQFVVLTIALLVLFIFFCTIPAIIFAVVEKWAYGDAFYYTFITLTTIGFGDFVVGADPDLSYPTVYRVGVYFWILFGLAFMATSIDLISDFLRETSPINRKRDDDDDDGSRNHTLDKAREEDLQQKSGDGADQPETEKTEKLGLADVQLSEKGEYGSLSSVGSEQRAGSTET